MEERVSDSELHKHIDYYVMIIKGFLHSSEKDEIQNAINKINWIEKKSHSQSKLPENAYTFDDDLEINDILMPKINAAILKYISSYNLPWFKEFKGYTRTQFLKHEEGQSTSLHCDLKHEIFTNATLGKGVPLLTITGLLNNDFEGGELYMYGYKKVNIEAGDLVIFPSNFVYPYEIKTITKGTRYSYSSWAW